ncbi:hypothetical protein D9M68_302590 [compost metagenome]
MALKRKGILPFARDPTGGRDVFGGDAHVRIADLVRRHAGALDGRELAAALQRRPQTDMRAAGALGPAGQVEAAGTRLDHPRRERDRLQPGAALPIDGHARRRDRQACFERCEPGEIAGAVCGIAENDVVDIGRFQPDIAENTGDQRCCQLRGFDIAKRAVDPADWCPERGNDHRCACRLSR